jgi:4-amino-4-deoxy-L-arabinose transferase-like glycosyltransferase
MLLDTTPVNRISPSPARVAIVVSPDVRKPTWVYTLAAAYLILASVVFHVAYLLWWCPLDLAPDEAHYWLWSQNLDWSYYSKGPLVAWLVRASCEIFGPSAFGVRFPAVVCHAALLAGLYALAAVTVRCHRTALFAVAAALTLPPVTAAAVVMTIDPPFLACWCWALVFAWKGISTGSRKWWVAAGVCTALGVLAKFTMLLLPAAVGLYLLANRRTLRGFTWMVAGAAVGCVPIVLWNAAHDWVSLRHVGGQAAGKGWRVLGPLAFVGGQAGVLIGYWLAAFALAAWKFLKPNPPAPFPPREGGENGKRPRDDRPWAFGVGGGVCSDNGLSFLWWTSVPVWGVFLLASFRTAGQVNWPAAAYIGGLILAVVVVREQLALRPRAARLLLAVALAAGVSVSAVAHFPALARPVFHQLAGPETDANRPAVRRVDPTCRLRGWRTLAKEIDAIRDRVRAETGTDPALAGMVWTTPGELSFYCQGNPRAYSFGSALGDRHSQFDVWRPNPVDDAQAFRGRTFVYVGDEIPDAARVFDRVEPPLRVVYSEGGRPVAVWTVWVCHGFRGFPPRRASGF